MITVQSRCEHTLTVDPPVIVSKNAGVTATVLADMHDSSEEFISRTIQNVSGAGVLVYYALATDANVNVYHGVLQQYQQLDCSNGTYKVSCWSDQAWKVATTTMRRDKYGA